MEPTLKQYFDKEATGTIWKTSMKDLWSVIKEIGKLLKSDKHLVAGMIAVMKNGLIVGQPKQTEKDLELSNV